MLAVAMLFAAAAGLAGMIYWRTSEALVGAALFELAGEAEVLEAEARSTDLARLAATVTTLSRFPSRGLYLLSDASGRSVAGNLERIPLAAGSRERGTLTYTSRDLGRGDGPARLAAFIRMKVPQGELFVGRDIEDQRALSSSTRWLSLLGLGGVLLAGLGGGWLLSRRVGRRLEGVNEAARSIMDGDLSRRIALSDRGDEIDTAARNLNDMLDRIEQLMAGLREVSDNIAHDLKTPLSRLRIRAEAALRDPRGDAACREGLERTIEDADQLIQTFNALLLIARLEAGSVEDNLSDFDLCQVARDVAELYEPSVELAGLALAVSADGQCPVRANRQLIGQAIANLVDNAIKYSASPRAGEAPGEPGITVQVKDAGSGMVEISVADRGPGIPPEDRGRVLKRFVRLDRSRSKPGTGLGLSLVAAVARLHAGEVRLEDNLPGLRVVLRLPRRG